MIFVSKNVSRLRKKQAYALRRESRHICQIWPFDDGVSAPPPPDYTPIAAAAKEASRLGYNLGSDQLAEARRQYNTNLETARPVLDTLQNTMGQTAEQGQDYYDYMRANQRPIEGQLNTAAMGLTTAEQREYNALRAQENESYDIQNSAYEARVAAQPTTKSGLETGAVYGADIIKPTFPNTRKGRNASREYDAKNVYNDNTQYIKKADGTYRVARMVDTVTPGVGTAVTGPNDRAVRNSSRSDAFLQDIEARANETSLAASEGERGLLTGSNANLQRDTRYGSQIAEEAATAGVDQMSGYSRALNVAARQGMRYGYSPEKMAAQVAAQAGGQASRIASATNQARNAATDRARGLVSTGRNLRLQDEGLKTGRRMDVAGLYRGLPGASQGAYGTAINAGNSTMSAGMAPGQAYMQGMGQGASLQMQGANARVQGANTIAGMQQQYGDTVAQISAANAGSKNQMVGTAVGLALASDRRLKEDIKLVGEVMPGVGLYEFKYKNSSGEVFRGVMADEVEKAVPEAVVTGSDGFKAVNYHMLGIKMEVVQHGQQI